MTRLLTDEEIKSAVQVLHKRMFPYHSDELQDWHAITQGQDIKTLKAVGEWILEDITPYHLRVWADSIDSRLGYKDSTLSFFLVDLADRVDQLKQGKMPEGDE